MGGFSRFTITIGVWAILAVQYPARAGQSLVLTSSTRILTQLSSAPRYAAIRNWRIEGLADKWTPHGVRVGLWEIDSSASIAISADNTLVLSGFQNESIGVPLGSITSFRWVGQSNASTGKYTLEVWDQQTGKYLYSECPLNSTNPVDRRNYRVSIGSFYEPVGPDIRLAYLRWYSSTRPVGGTPPSSVLSKGGPLRGPAGPDLMDLEFDGNLRDSSGSGLYLSVMAGQATYAATTAWPPSVNLGTTPLSVRAGSPVALDGTHSFANNDDNVISCAWAETSSPQPGTWDQQNTCAPTFTPTAFGTYTLSLIVKDSSGQASSQSFKLGSVVTDDHDIVRVADAKMDLILGPMIRYGASPWSWFDNRQKALADNQVKLLDTAWIDYWNTPNPHGTVNVTYNSKIITGSGTTFQNDFCGGPQNTTPVATTSEIYIWYNSPDYPGQTGRGRYNVVSCDSQTQITLDYPYVHTPNDTNRSYTVVNPQQEAGWVYTPIPGDYYDNVLALYNMYYRSGIDTYRDAARTLAGRFWTGPNWDLGQNYNANVLGGKWSVAGPARGQSVTGLILWSLDTGTNIWKGVHHLWDIWILFTQPARSGGQMGDVRENAYFTGGLALCMLYDPDTSYSQKQCPSSLHGTINGLWKPLETAAGAWSNTVTDASFMAADGKVWVNVVDGSPFITLNNSSQEAVGGGCANAAEWCAQSFTNGTKPLDRWLWFINDPANVGLPGKQSSDIGDTVAYKIGNLIDGTHATLTAPYQSGKCPAPNGCKKGLVVSHVVGFGTQPFMLGLAIGVFADYVYKALISQNMNDDAATVKGFILDGSKWLVTVGYDPKTGGLWGARGFINCEPDPSVECASSPVLNGEAMRGYAAGYLLSRDPAVLTAGDALFQAQWCKPTGGWTCPFPPTSATYMADVDDQPLGYMITNQPSSNKWLGFFFGYGFGSSWPAARVIGQLPPEYRVFTIAVKINTVPSAAKVRATVIQTSGASQEVICSGPPCEVKIDVRRGRSLMKLDYLNSSGKVISRGTFSALESK